LTATVWIAARSLIPHQFQQNLQAVQATTRTNTVLNETIAEHAPVGALRALDAQISQMIDAYPASSIRHSSAGDRERLAPMSSIVPIVVVRTEAGQKTEVIGAGAYVPPRQWRIPWDQLTSTEQYAVLRYIKPTERWHSSVGEF